MCLRSKVTCLKSHRIGVGLLACELAMASLSAHARVSRIEVERSERSADGSYETLRGRAFGVLDPGRTRQRDHHRPGVRAAQRAGPGRVRHHLRAGQAGRHGQGERRAVVRAGQPRRAAAHLRQHGAVRPRDADERLAGRHRAHRRPTTRCRSRSRATPTGRRSRARCSRASPTCRPAPPRGRSRCSPTRFPTTPLRSTRAQAQLVTKRGEKRSGEQQRRAGSAGDRLGLRRLQQHAVSRQAASAHDLREGRLRSERCCTR